MVPGVARTQQRRDPRIGDMPEAEFHLARVIYRTNRRAGSHGYIQPMWAVDYPLADEHFLTTLSRYTRIQVAEDSRHLELTDHRLFDYPFLWLQQPAAGGWNPTPQEAQCLREYLTRGGFLMVDDFHGEYEWEYFEAVMKRVFPEKQFVDVPASDPLMHIFFDIDQSVPIPGDRHLRFGGQPRMRGPSHWRALYDDKPAHCHRESQHGYRRRLGTRGRSRVSASLHEGRLRTWRQLRDLCDDALGSNQSLRSAVNFFIGIK
jgi:hypothetical protein